MLIANFYMNGNGPWGWNNGVFGPTDSFGMFAGLFFGLFMLAAVAWTVYWKYYAIWHAVKHENKWWFIAFLLINTLGILEILYLYVFSKKIPAHDDKNLPMLP